MNTVKFGRIDWVLFFSAVPLLVAGLVTMRSFGAETDYHFARQLIWIAISFAAFFGFSVIDWRFLRKSEFLVALFLLSLFPLVVLLTFGAATRGASSWLKLPFLAIEPSEFVKIILILVLAKYFSRRHVEIAHVSHIFISAVYMAIPAGLVFLQPDFGSAIIIFLIWLGMIMVSGVSKKHLLAVFLIGAIAFGGMWLFVFKDYQKARIVTFLDPLHDTKGTGYNAMQSMIAVGSGQLFGKGIGYGSQSRLGFLPEPQTDFIFAAFAEEWGFLGIILLFIFYGLVLWRVLKNAMYGASNFETLFGIGIAVFIMAHFVMNVGMNIGLLPITGVSMPFMSYGGSHTLAIYSGLGILMGMRRYSRRIHPEDATAEFLGPR